MKQHLPDSVDAIKQERKILAAFGKDIIHFGNLTREYMRKAEQDVMLGTYTNVDTETVSYDNVGPEYVLATIMTSLFNEPLYQDEPIDSVYAGFYRTLVSAC